MQSESALESAPGKRKLIEAALRLTAGGRSFASLGLRELAREAGLNPNTFYRHFDSLDDLAREAVDWISVRLRPMLRRERWLAAHEPKDVPDGVPRRACVAFFAFALENREAFLSALAEYHGASQALRDAVRVNLPRETVEEICTQIVLQLFHLSHEFIGNAAQRDRLVDYAERFVVRLFAGAVAVAQYEAHG
jgi:TetR/AcrR family transcriptional regulator, fatty acid biosynthesis regulator